LDVQEIKLLFFAIYYFTCCIHSLSQNTVSLLASSNLEVIVTFVAKRAAEGMPEYLTLNLFAFVAELSLLARTLHEPVERQQVFQPLHTFMLRLKTLNLFVFFLQIKLYQFGNNLGLLVTMSEVPIQTLTPRENFSILTQSNSKSVRSLDVLY